MEKIHVAVIGCGTIATSSHIPAYTANKNAEICYFCDLIPERAQKAAEKYGRGKAITDYRTILQDKTIQAVSVCTPNNVHASITIDCLEAGLNVLCEKPAARTYEEALEMQKAQHKTGKVLNIGVVNRFNDSVKRIRKIIQSGALGTVDHVYVSFRSHRSIPGLGGAFTTKAIAGGGALIDWGVHFLDIVMFCCGDPSPKTVSGEIFSRLGKDIPGYVYTDMWAGPPVANGVYDVEEAVTAMVRTSGPVISLNGAWAQNIGEREMFIDFMGDKGGIRLQYGGNFKVYTTQDGALINYQPEFTQGAMFQQEIDSFLECIQTGEKLASHIDTAVITSRLMQAIYDSAEKHAEITL